MKSAPPFEAAATQPITGSRMLGAAATASAGYCGFNPASSHQSSIVVRLTDPAIVARQTGITAPGACAPGQHEGYHLG